MLPFLPHKKPRRIKHLAAPEPAMTAPMPLKTPEEHLTELENCELAAEEAEALGFHALRRQLIRLRQFGPRMARVLRLVLPTEHAIDPALAEDYLSALDETAELANTCQRASGHALATRETKLRALLQQSASLRSTSDPQNRKGVQQGT
jgi:hypothetical protein